MEFWFSEQQTPNVKLSIRVDRQLYSGRSEFQRIDVFDSPEFGRFLTLDGYMMLTEKDEFIYHEMITHVPMAVHPHVRKALVIGAGDGGVVRELTRYPEIEQIDLVEIDQLVVEVCKKYLPQTACRFDDPRVQIHYEDGLKFVRTCEDATACQRAHKRIVESFPISRVYQAHIPTYPSGHWLFGFASKKYHPLRDLQEARWNLRGLSCKYYTTTLHKGAFYLPAYVEELLKNVE